MLIDTARKPVVVEHLMLDAGFVPEHFVEWCATAGLTRVASSSAAVRALA